MPTCTPNIWASTRQWMGFIFWLGLSKRRREWADEHTAPANMTTTCNRPQRKIYNLTTDAYSFKCLFLTHAHQCPENYVHMICMHYITSTDGLNWLTRTQSCSAFSELPESFSCWSVFGKLLSLRLLLLLFRADVTICHFVFWRRHKHCRHYTTWAVTARRAHRSMWWHMTRPDLE